VWGSEFTTKFYKKTPQYRGGGSAEIAAGLKHPYWELPTPLLGQSPNFLHVI